jgi:hypothetical protein
VLPIPRGPIRAVDYRPFFGAVRDRGSRGTCTAFGSTAVAEAMEFLRDPRNGPRDFAEQLVYWYSKAGKLHIGGGYKKIPVEVLRQDLLTLVTDSIERDADATGRVTGTSDRREAPLIFISYRREDSSGWAGRLCDRLRQHYGGGSLFMDIDDIEVGLDFAEVIERTVEKCDVLIALIGKYWLAATNDEGRRRIDLQDDYVRIEVSMALKRNIRVIPALLRGAAMPRSADLPEDLRPLVRRNALEISEKHFDQDVDELIKALQKAQNTAKPVLAPGSQ